MTELGEQAQTSRKTKYTPELADEICERLAAGESLNEICKSDDRFPNETQVRRWAIADLDGFALKYAHARELQADHYFDLIRIRARDCRLGVKTEESVDDKGLTTTKTIQADMIERSRLEIDALKWIAARIAPRKYGDRLALTDGDGKPLQVASTTVIALAQSMSPEQLLAARERLQTQKAPDPLQIEGQVVED